MCSCLRWAECPRHRPDCLALRAIPASEATAFFNPLGASTLADGSPNPNRIDNGLGSGVTDAGRALLLEDYRWVDAGPRMGSVTKDEYRLVLGMRGNFGDWDYDTGLLYAQANTTDLTRNRQQAMARRSALEADVNRWDGRLNASAARVESLVKRRAEAASEAGHARARPEALQTQLDGLATRVEGLEAERQEAADTLAAREAEIREVEDAARSTNNLAMSARETLAIANAKLENATERLSEASEIAQSQFQRAPEGLIAIAKAGMEEHEMEALDVKEAERQIDFLRRDRENLGGVNMEAESEVEELSSRLGLQAEEKADLTAAIAKLREGVAALNDEGRTRLLGAFDQVNEHFKALFTALFRGGEAELRLVDADDPLAAGLEIFAQPPGKRLGTLSLMSGGEQALTATALIFAVFLSRPSPICVLDEVDAPLDDANVDRFCRMLDEMRQRTDTRFIVITHNPVTMSRMDRLFGVTMREKGVSKLVSVDLDAAEELVAAE